jgi:hypothetical protein
VSSIDIDVIGAEALQAIGERVLHRRRPAVDPEEAALRIAQRAELDAELVGIPRPPFQRARQEHFVVSGAVEIAGVE